MKLRLITGEKNLALIDNDEINHDYLVGDEDRWCYLYINKELIGILIHKKVQSIIILKLIYVTKHYRGKGYGKTIYKIFEMKLRKFYKNDKRIILHDVSDYKWFYMKLGFSKSDDDLDKYILENEESREIDGNIFYKEIIL